MFFTINCVVTVLCSVVFTEALYGSSSDVVELTAGNFDGKVLQSDDIWLVEFYAPWCGHCQSLAPEWKKAATALKGIIKVGAVDMDVHSSVGGPYNVRGFPTIKIFGVNKNSPTDYNGPRTAQGLTKAALEAAQSAVNQRLSGGSSSGGKSNGDGKSSGGGGGSGNAKDVIELTDGNFEEKVLQSSELWLVEFYAPWCGHCQRLEPEWKKAATELKGKVNLGALDATVHSGMAQRYGIQGFPSIKYFAPGSEPVDYQGGRTASDIVQFALSKLAENVPPPEIIQLTETKILTDNCNEQPLCVVSVLPDILDTGAQGRNAYLDILKEIGEKYKSKLWGWVWTEAGKHVKLEEALGMGGFGYPTLAAVNVRKMKFSILKGSFDKTGIDEFLRALAVGRGSTEPIRGATLPELETVEPWDGQDGQLPEEEDFDLSDFDMDDDSEKDEL